MWVYSITGKLITNSARKCLIYTKIKWLNSLATCISEPVFCWKICKYARYPIILFVIYNCIFNRPGVAGAVLQSASSLIQSPRGHFLPNLQNIINHKPEELGRWNFERMFTPHYMSHVTCRISRVTCHVSHATCNMSHVLWHFFSSLLFWKKVVKLFCEGSVINGAYPV